MLNIPRPVMTAALVTTTAVAFHLLAGCSGLPKRGHAGNVVTIGQPAVYTRERTISQRFEDIEWLREQLSSKDYEQGTQGSTASRVRDEFGAKLAVDLLANQRGAGEDDETPPEDDSTDDPPTSQPSSNDDVVATLLQGMDEAELRELLFAPANRTGIDRTPQAKLDDRLGIRSAIRQAMAERGLDDTHDLAGFSLYELQFDLTLAPGHDSGNPIAIMMHVSDAACCPQSPCKHEDAMAASIRDALENLINTLVVIAAERYRTDTLTTSARPELLEEAALRGQTVAWLTMLETTIEELLQIDQVVKRRCVICEERFTPILEALGNLNPLLDANIRAQDAAVHDSTVNARKLWKPILQLLIRRDTPPSVAQAKRGQWGKLRDAVRDTNSDRAWVEALFTALHSFNERMPSVYQRVRNYAQQISNHDRFASAVAEAMSDATNAKPDIMAAWDQLAPHILTAPQAQSLESAESMALSVPMIPRHIAASGFGMPLREPPPKAPTTPGDPSLPSTEEIERLALDAGSEAYGRLIRQHLDKQAGLSRDHEGRITKRSARNAWSRAKGRQVCSVPVVIDVEPNEQVEQLSSSVRSLLTRAFSAAVDGLIGAETGIAGELQSLRESLLSIETITRNPLLVGMVQASGFDADVNASGFGWIIGPPLEGRQPDVGGAQVWYRHVPTHHAVSATLIASAWLERVKIETQVYEIRPDGNWRAVNSGIVTTRPYDVESIDSGAMEVRLPADPSAVAYWLVHGGTRNSAQPLLAPPPGTQWALRADERGELVIQGLSVWRDPQVYVNGQRATSVGIFSDLNGLHVVFDKVATPAGMDKAPMTVDLLVSTSAGTDVIAGGVLVHPKRAKLAASKPTAKPTLGRTAVRAVKTGNDQSIDLALTFGTPLPNPLTEFRLRVGDVGSTGVSFSDDIIAKNLRHQVSSDRETINIRGIKLNGQPANARTSYEVEAWAGTSDGSLRVLTAKPLALLVFGSDRPTLASQTQVTVGATGSNWNTIAATAVEVETPGVSRKDLNRLLPRLAAGEAEVTIGGKTCKVTLLENASPARFRFEIPANTRLGTGTKRPTDADAIFTSDGERMPFKVALQ